MKLHLLTLALLAGTSLATVAVAQDATQPANPKPAAGKPQPATQAAGQPQKATRDPRSQPGLTSGPTDFGRVDISGSQGSEVVPTGLGVNRQDLGGGYMIPEDALKSRSTVTRDAIAKQSPTANPYQMINLLPGVNMSSTTNSGLNGGNIKIRGYNSDQLGLTIEGMPVNDSGNYALYPQEYVDSENIDQISIAQGSPDLDSPHIGASGGVINIYMRDPSKVRGGFVDLSYGSNSEWRSFLRAESGQVGNFRGYVSFSHDQQKHWLAPGRDSRNHVDFKGVWDIGLGNRAALSLIYNWAVNDFYPNPTLAQFNAAGGFVNPYLRSLPASYFTGPDQSANGASNYYEFKTNPFRNLIASAPSSFTINKDMTVDVVPYFWYGFGNGGGVSTVAESPVGTVPAFFYGTRGITGVDWNGNGVVVTGNKALLYNPSITETYRPGVINKLTYTIGDHKLVFGYWLEYANHKQTAPYANLSPTGQIVDPFLTSGAIALPGLGTLERRDTLTKTLTNTVFAGDTWTPMGDKLEVEYGTKVSAINRTVDNFLPGTTPSYTRNDLVALPTAGLRYHLTEEHQVYGSINTSFKSTPNFALADSVSNSTGIVSPANPLKPEHAVTLEVGHRFQSQLFATSLALYGSHYENHQVSTNAVINGIQESGVSINAGSVDLWGVAFEIGTRPLWNAFRPYFSANYLQTRINTNLESDVSATRPDFLPTKGKELPGSPHLTLALGLDYDDGHILGNLAAKYTSRQYATFMNDQSIPAFTRVDAMLGYRFDDIGFAKRPEFRINFFNIFNTHVLTGVSSITNNAVATVGLNGNTINASNPSYYLGQGFSALATFSAAF